MGKAMGSWIAVRKYLEQDMLCDSLKGRVRYKTFPGVDGDGIFNVFVDGKSIKTFSFLKVSREVKNLYNVKSSGQEYWKNYWDYMDSSFRDEYTDFEFASSLAHYRQSDILSPINSSNPIVRMFAILDRRLGKRTLLKIKDTVSAQPKWLQFFYNLRLTAENIT